MVRRGRRKGGKYEEGDVAVVVIPTDSRKIVRRLQEIVDFPEQEIYRTLVHCRRNPHVAVARLLAQAEEAKGKEEEKEEETADSCSQQVDSIIEKGEFSNAGECDGSEFNSDESSNAQGTVMAGSSTTADILGPYKSDLTNDETNIVPISADEAVPSISEPSSSDLTNGETEIVPTSSAEALPPISVPSSSDLTNGEAEIVTTSSAEAVPSISAPSSSDLINGDATLVPISSAEAVSSISVPSSRDLTNVGTKKVPKSSSKSVLLTCPRPCRLISSTPEQRTMADVVKMSLGLSKENVTTATLKDDPSSNSLIESATTRDQLQEPASVSNQDLCDDDVTSTFSNSFIDSAAKSDQLQESTTLSNQNLCDDNVNNPFSNSYPESSWISNEILRDQLRESASVFNQNLHDNSLSYLFKSFIEYGARQDQLVSNQKLRDDDVTNPFSYSFVEAAAGRNQLCESTGLSNQNSHNEYGGLLGGEDNNKNDGIYQVERHSFELNRTEDLPASVATCLQQLSIETDEPEASVKDDEPTHQQVNTSELPLLIFGTYGSGQATNFLLQSSNDDSEEIDDPKTFVTDKEQHHQHVNTSGLQHLTFGTFGEPEEADDFSLKDLITSYGEEEQVQRRNVTNEQMREQLISQCLDQYRPSSARDFTFDRTQWLAPSKPSLRMQSVNAVLDVTHQQADIRETDSLFSAFPFNQPMPTKLNITTASSPCRMSPVSLTKALNPATTFELQNNHYSQPEIVPYSNMMNRPYSLLNQNDSYNFSPSAFQQHGGSNKSIYCHQSPASVLPLHGNSNLPRSIAPIGPSSNVFGDINDIYHHRYLPSTLPQYRNINLPQSDVPIVPSANSSTYNFGTSSYDTVDRRFNDNSNRFSPILRQSANSSLLPPQRRENSRVQEESKFQSLFLDLENQKSPIFRHSQSPSFSHSLSQGQEQLYRDVGQERSNLYLSPPNQDDPRSDSSNKFQQREWPKDKY